MDRKLSKDQELEQLIFTAAAARSQLGEEAAALRQRLDVPMRIRASLKSHPTQWLLGSLGAGLLASVFTKGFSSRKRVKKEPKPRKFYHILLGLTLTAVRPFAKVWLTDQLKKQVLGQLGRSGAGRAYPGQRQP
ncbi:hypothetical protein JIN84_22145 [Luteolibacter yonseiensis]|uniref:Uncharacterized protein n=1 Tax=Luteolibacter yonseiensis TaxID=1144680 RepID=A0A934R7A3_9BACT|nr:hypothetical protein [Luteolibacter yonseiensis]MBK1818337.1 hypothetical protein [Luteolibacter yonseiensis]